MPIIIAHLVKCAVAGDAGIVHDHIDRSYLGGHPGAAVQARLMVAHVPFVRLDPGVGLELFGGGIVARVIGDDGEARVLQLLTDSAANASCSASNDCNACHSRISKYNSSIRGSDAVASWESKTPPKQGLSYEFIQIVRVRSGIAFRHKPIGCPAWNL